MLKQRLLFEKNRLEKESVDIRKTKDKIEKDLIEELSNLTEIRQNLEDEAKKS